MKKYASLIVDIKSSRSYKNSDRFYIQEKLFKICELMNKIFVDSIESPLTFSSGDSIQGLFKNAGACLRCSLVMKTLFLPFEIRVGIGIGTINNKTLSESKKLYSFTNSNFVEGEAYHFAREALEEAEETKNDVIILSNKYEDFLLNNLLIISYELRKSLSIKQKELLFIYDFFSPILSIEEDDKYNEYFSDCFDLADFDKMLSNKVIRKEDLKFGLFTLFHNNQFSNKLEKIINYHYIAKPIFESSISSRNSDVFVAKLLNVSPQNISLLKKRGYMNRIRTEEELVADYLERIFND